MNWKRLHLFTFNVIDSKRGLCVHGCLGFLDVSMLVHWCIGDPGVRAAASDESS